MGSAQVPFIANQGQLPAASVSFYARTFAGVLFVTEMVPGPTILTILW
jgi:hypothetical protein